MKNHMTPVKASAKTPLTREAFLAEVKKLDIKTTSQQLLAALSLAGQIALNQPNPQGKTLQVQAMEAKEENDLISQVTQEEHEEIMAKMVGFAHRPPGHLDKEEELYLEQQLADMLGFEVTAQLDGQRLNHSIGVMGSEQHLMRFPGDDLSQHDAYREAGIAANRGAFGWFTENGQLTDEAIAREKYYFAVQTMYLTDWNEAYKQLKDWYKFRKMILINPVNGNAVICDIGDAGPAEWTGKQFGGSPEVMERLSLHEGPRKGLVLMFFVDDPKNEVPLGPINY